MKAITTIKPTLCSDELTDKLVKCVHAYNLPDSCDAPANELVRLCHNDKKRVSNSINYIICEEIGKASIRKVTVDEFEKFILE